MLLCIVFVFCVFVCGMLLFRSIAICFLIVVAWQSGGYYIAFEMARATARSTMQAHIANKRYDLKSLQVVEVSLHEKNKYWHFYHDEYVIAGKLYDVVASDTLPECGVVRLQVLHDAYEQGIYENLYSYFKPVDSPIGAKRANQLVQYLSLKYITSMVVGLPPPIFVAIDALVPLPNKCLATFISIDLDSDSPPPWRACL